MLPHVLFLDHFKSFLAPQKKREREKRKVFQELSTYQENTKVFEVRRGIVKENLDNSPGLYNKCEATASSYPSLA